MIPEKIILNVYSIIRNVMFLNMVAYDYIKLLINRIKLHLIKLHRIRLYIKFEYTIQNDIIWNVI